MIHTTGPKSWTVGGVIRWAATAIFVFCFTLFAEENVRHYLEQQRWNAALTSLLDGMPNIAQEPWFWAVFGLAAGITLTSWVAKVSPEWGLGAASKSAPSKLIIVGTILLFGGAIAGIIGAAIIYSVKKQTPDQSSIVGVPHGGEEYLRNVQIVPADSGSNILFHITALPRKSIPKLGIYMDYTHRDIALFGPWYPKQRIYLEEIRDAVPELQIKIPLVHKKQVEGTTEQHWWGAPNNQRGNYVRPNATLARIVFIGPNDQQQYFYFAFMNPKGQFVVVQGGDFDFLKEWESFKN